MQAQEMCKFIRSTIAKMYNENIAENIRIQYGGSVKASNAKELLSTTQLRKFYKVFINLDPPYVKKGAQLYKNAFREEDHRELCELVSKCKRKWNVTYDICPLVADLYHSYRSSYLDVTYSIQSSKKAKEYIFFSDNLTLPESIELRE